MTIVGFHVSAEDLTYLGHDLSNTQNDIDALDDKKTDPSADKRGPVTFKISILEFGIYYTAFTSETILQ